MSDVTVAPPSGAPPSASNEVQINQNPTNQPNPVGPQAGTAPVGDLKGSEHRPQSRSESAREAIQKAFDRANDPAKARDVKPAQRGAPKPAEARLGHNQPPEETPKLDLKKRPDDQPQAKGDRNERGQFAPRQRQDGQTGQVGHAQDAQNAPSKYKQLPPHAPYAEPPVRISERARRDWADTPESVRGDVHRWQSEFTKAYTYYKNDIDAFKPIKQYHEMATKHGTTLERALNNYVTMEQKLRADPIGGLDVIVSNLNIQKPDGTGKADLRDIAYYVLSQSPEQLAMMKQGNQQNAAQHQIGALHQEITGLKQTLQQMHTQQQFSYTRSAVDQFANSHPRFDELGTLIEQELKLGFDLETAYRRADRLQPATHAAQTRSTPAQTRPTDRSIHGYPDVAPSNGASRRTKEASPTARDAVRNAMSRLNGSH
jgi:hypothetical protein